MSGENTNGPHCSRHTMNRCEPDRTRVRTPRARGCDVAHLLSVDLPGAHSEHADRPAANTTTDSVESRTPRKLNSTASTKQRDGLCALMAPCGQYGHCTAPVVAENL